jgi:hypothetical protein
MHDGYDGFYWVMEAIDGTPEVACLKDGLWYLVGRADPVKAEALHRISKRVEPDPDLFEIPEERVQ